MSELKATELKKFLTNLSDVELRGEIVDLFKLFPVIKEYYKVKLNPESEKEILEKYKKIIKDEFFPDRGFGKLRYSIMKKALEDFRKLSRSLRYLITSSTGQWSEPITDAWISACRSLSFNRSEVQK